jgi:hypothetical protein
MKPAWRSLPRSRGKLKALGARVLVERGAGTAAHFTDNAYADAELTDARRFCRAPTSWYAFSLPASRPSTASKKAPWSPDSCRHTRGTTWCGR